VKQGVLTTLPRVGDASSATVVSLRHTTRDSAIRRALACADAAALGAGLVAVLALSNRELGPQLAVGVLTLPAWIVLFKVYGLYDRDITRVSHTTVDDLPWVFHALLVGSLLLWLLHAAWGESWRFAELLAFAATTLVAVLGFRSATRRAMSARVAPERVLLIGGGEAVATLARKMRAHPEYRLDPVALVAAADSPAARSGVPLVGSPEGLDVERTLRTERVDRLMISPVDLGEHDLLDLLRRCKELAIKVSLLPQLFDAMGSSVELDDVEGVTVLGINPPVLSRSSRLLKRGMDLAGAALGLLLAAPLLLLVAVAIKLDSRGPVLFRQERIGKANRRFRLLKFRTMVQDAERQRAQLETESLDPDWLLLEHDPRVTRVGRILRMTSLDELPQLVNVLRGEMSLVGPRPLIAAEDEQITGWRRCRVDLTPGLTGLWQVLGRTRIPFDEMVKLDYLYVTNWSLWTDVRLLVRTLPAVLTQRGAN
jgi:exopolysaccharide biosynthesis polyprenyl glycosylphosphotransferase